MQTVWSWHGITRQRVFLNWKWLEWVPLMESRITYPWPRWVFKLDDVNCHLTWNGIGFTWSTCPIYMNEYFSSFQSRYEEGTGHVFSNAVTLLPQPVIWVTDDDGDETIRKSQDDLSGWHVYTMFLLLLGLSAQINTFFYSLFFQT